MKDMVLIIVLVIKMVEGTKYRNDVHGNTVQVDKSSGFHILELHGFSVGVTSSIFISAFLLICAAYVAVKLGINKMFRCCCNNSDRMVESGMAQQMQMMQQQQPIQRANQVQPVQMASPMQLQSRNNGEDQSNSLDLPRVLTLKVTQ